MTATTFHVYERCGNRWVCVGQFQSLRTDRVSVKEELRHWLGQQGISYDNHPSMFSARKVS